MPCRPSIPIVHCFYFTVTPGSSVDLLPRWHHHRGFRWLSFQAPPVISVLEAPTTQKLDPCPCMCSGATNCHEPARNDCSCILIISGSIDLGWSSDRIRNELELVEKCLKDILKCRETVFIWFQTTSTNLAQEGSLIQWVFCLKESGKRRL